MGGQADISPERVLEELVAIGFARATDYFCVRDGNLEIRSTDDLSPEAVKAIAGVERSSSGLKLKFYDKLKALELLGKHFGFFEGNGSAGQKQNNLLDAIVAATQEEVDVHDIPEIQQAANSCDDMVEQTRAAGL